MYPKFMFYREKIRKYQDFFHLKIIVFTAVKSCSILHRRVIVMVQVTCPLRERLRTYKIITKYHFFTLIIISSP